MELQDVTLVEGSNNIPGVFKAVFIPFADISVLPDVVNPNPEETTAQTDDVVNIESDIIMKPGKRATEIYFTNRTGDYKSTLQGADDSKNYKNTFKFSTPFRAKGFAAFQTKVKNLRGVMLINLNGGETIMLGGPRKPVMVESSEAGFGVNATESASGSPTFYCDDTVSLRYFKGKLMVGAGSGGGSGVGAEEQILFAN